MRSLDIPIVQFAMPTLSLAMVAGCRFFCQIIISLDVYHIVAVRLFASTLTCFCLDLRSILDLSVLATMPDYQSRSSPAGITRKTRIIDVIYNASNNELVRTKTLVKSCIVQIDSTPFRQWYEAHYATPLGRKKSVKLVGCLPLRLSVFWASAVDCWFHYDGWSS